MATNCKTVPVFAITTRGMSINKETLLDSVVIFNGAIVRYSSVAPKVISAFNTREIKKFSSYETNLRVDALIYPEKTSNVRPQKKPAKMLAFT